MNQWTFFNQQRPYIAKHEWYESFVVYEHLQILFETANQKLIQKDRDLFIRNSHETAICGALMHRLYSVLFGTPFKNYNVDIEYNRNFNGGKRIYTTEERNITCDLIVHSRGRSLLQDNLIAVEMKKESATPLQKRTDRERLMALTKPSYDDEWVYDGTEHPKYVCRYILGVYYEIRTNIIYIEYYRQGQLLSVKECCW